MDNYFKDTLRAGTSKVDKAPKIPRAPKQIAMYVRFMILVLILQFFACSPESQHDSLFPLAILPLTMDIQDLRLGFRGSALPAGMDGVCVICLEGVKFDYSPSAIGDEDLACDPDPLEGFCRNAPEKHPLHRSYVARFRLLSRY